MLEFSAPLVAGRGSKSPWWATLRIDRLSEGRIILVADLLAVAVVAAVTDLIITIIAFVLLLNVLTPEVRRSAFRRSVAEVKNGEWLHE